MPQSSIFGRNIRSRGYYREQRERLIDKRKTELKRRGITVSIPGKLGKSKRAA